jgi:hypothetical protein
MPTGLKRYNGKRSALYYEFNVHTRQEDRKIKLYARESGEANAGATPQGMAAE